MPKEPTELRLSLPSETLQEAVDRAIARQLGDKLHEIKLLDKQQAADLLGVSTKRFVYLARKHGVTAIALGERLSRWSVGDLQSLIERHRVISP